MADKPQLPKSQNPFRMVEFSEGPYAEFTADASLHPNSGPTFWGDVRLYSGYRIQKHYLTGHGRILDRKDRRVFWGTLEECHDEVDRLDDVQPLGSAGKHLVLCLHGIFRSKNAMNKMRDGFLDAGYNAWSINYPSTSRTIDEHSIDYLLQQYRGRAGFWCVINGWSVAERSSLVPRWTTHVKPHRLVMIGTPNQGALHRPKR